jgi:hypothetical protein
MLVVHDMGNNINIWKTKASETSSETSSETKSSETSNET